MAQIQCGNPKCDRKYHISPTVMEQYHRGIGIVGSGGSSVSSAEVLGDFTSGYDDALMEELVEDIQYGLSVVSKNHAAMEKQENEIRNELTKVRSRQAYLRGEIGSAGVDELRDIVSKMDELDDSARSLESQANSLEIDRKYDYRIIDGVELSEYSDDEVDVVKNIVAQVYQEAVAVPKPYVDPFPDKPGKHSVMLQCPSCGGSGVYDGKGGDSYIVDVVINDTLTQAKGCYQCGGTGRYKTTTSKIRSEERKRANEEYENYEKQMVEAVERAHAAVDRQIALENMEKGVKPDVGGSEKSQGWTLQSLREKYPEGTKIAPERVKVVGSRTFANTYRGKKQVKHVVTFEGENDQKFVWFTTSNVGVSQGDVCSLGGTVKRVEKNDYDGQLQVVLTRGKISDVDGG